MQNRKEIVEKAIKEFAQKNCSKLLESDISLLMDIIIENLQNNVYNNIDRAIQLIGAVHTNQQKDCFINFSIDDILDIKELHGYDTTSSIRPGSGSEEHFSADLDIFYESTQYKKIIDLLDNKLDSLISDRSDDILTELLFSNIFYNKQLYHFYEKILEHFLLNSEYDIVLKFIDSLGNPYDVLHEIRPSFLYPCLKYAFMSHNTEFLKSIQNIIFDWFGALQQFGIVSDDAKYLSKVVDLYVQKSEDIELGERLVKIIINQIGLGDVDQMLIMQSFKKRVDVVVDAINKSLLNSSLQKFEQEFQISDKENRKRDMFISICENLALFTGIIDGEKILSILPLFEFLSTLIPHIEKNDNEFYSKHFDYKKNEQNLKVDFDNEQRTSVDIEHCDDDRIRKNKRIRFKKQQLLYLNEMFGEVIELLNANTNNLNKGNIIITIVRKLVEIKLLAIKLFKNSYIDLEIFPLRYFKNSLQSKDNEASDALFVELLSLFAINFKRNMYEDDQKHLTDLLDTFFANNRIDYVIRMLRLFIVIIKPESDKITRENALYILLNLISNRMLEENDDSSNVIQLDNYVNILFNALNERKNDELYEENNLNELLAFEVISHNLKSVIERISMKQIKILVPLIKLIRDSIDELVSDDYLEKKYKKDELINNIDINQFLNSSFHIASAFIENPNFAKKPTEYFEEDEWNLHKDIINKCYRKYQNKAFTGKVSGYLNFISRYLESSINTEDELINKKAKILSNIVHILNAKLRTYFETKKIEDARIEERNRIMANLSHTVKTMLSNVIDPLQNMKETRIVKPIKIDNALRGAELIKSLVNAMNLSFKGSIEDFIYDVQNNSYDNSSSIEEMFIDSIKQAISTMFDGKYFKDFVDNYYTTKAIFIEAKRKWNDISQLNDIEKIISFLNENLVKTTLDISKAKEYVIGDDKGSALKLLILIQEIIMNAVKYSSFVSKESRNLHINFDADEKNISIIISNTFKPNVQVKSSGLGQEIIKNFSTLLQTEPIINTDNNLYSVEIKFENVWRTQK